MENKQVIHSTHIFLEQLLCARHCSRQLAKLIEQTESRQCPVNLITPTLDQGRQVINNTL